VRTWKQTVLLVLPLLVVAVGLGYVQHLRSQPKPGDYVKTAMNAPAVGKKSNGKLLLEACGTVNWSPMTEQDGGYVVEARGTQKQGGKEVVVRWQVYILRDGNVTSSVANLVFASIGGVELDPPSKFTEQLSSEPKGK